MSRSIFKTFLLNFTSFCLVVLFVGCGGGGGGSGDLSPSAAEGLWEGTTNNGRALSFLVLDDGTYWALYTVQGNSSTVAGVVQGTSSSQNGTFTSSNSRDFNLEGLGINNATINATYVPMQSLNGVFRYTSSGEQVIFNSSYNSDYDLIPDLAILAGTYYGPASTSGGYDTATLTISTAGAISGISDMACSFSGSVSPRSSGNIYNTTITFHGGTCANGNSTVRGILYYDETSARLYSAALNNSRSDGYIFIGYRL